MFNIEPYTIFYHTNDDYTLKKAGDIELPCLHCITSQLYKSEENLVWYYLENKATYIYYIYICFPHYAVSFILCLNRSILLDWSFYLEFQCLLYNIMKTQADTKTNCLSCHMLSITPYLTSEHLIFNYFKYRCAVIQSMGGFFIFYICVFFHCWYNAMNWWNALFSN